MPLDSFNAISASLHNGEIKDYYYESEDEDEGELQEADLKDLIVLEKPTITLCDYLGFSTETFNAPNGRHFTVGQLFDAIARYDTSHRGYPGDHRFFEGIEEGRGGYSIMWGS